MKSLRALAVREERVTLLVLVTHAMSIFAKNAVLLVPAPAGLIVATASVPIVMQTTATIFAHPGRRKDSNEVTVIQKTQCEYPWISLGITSDWRHKLQECRLRIASSS